MAKRFTLTPEGYIELKRKVFKRDGWACRKCKSKTGITAHHIIFRSDGGGDYSSNLVTLCQRVCHKAVHGLIRNNFIVICDPESDLIPPDADKGIRFKTYSKVQRRITWRTK